MVYRHSEVFYYSFMFPFMKFGEVYATLLEAVMIEDTSFSIITAWEEAPSGGHTPHIKRYGRFWNG